MPGEQRRPCQNPDLFHVNLKLVSERSFVLPDVFAFLPPDRGERARATPPVCPWSSAEEKSRLRFSLEHFVKIVSCTFACYCLHQLFSFVFSYQLKRRSTVITASQYLKFQPSGLVALHRMLMLTHLHLFLSCQDAGPTQQPVV